MTAIPVPPPPTREYPLPSAPPRYSFIAGTWGDVLCGLGNHQHLMRSLGCESGAVLYYGPDATIADWLRIQPMVGEVVDVRSPGPVKGIPTDPAKVGEWYPHLVAAVRLNDATKYSALPAICPEALYPCHVDFTLRERLPVHRPELVTPRKLKNWAKETLNLFQGMDEEPGPDHENPNPWVLFQPRSETSCLWEGHWPYWHDAAAFLQTAHDGTNFLCGKGDFGEMFGDLERTQNLVNATPSMPHLFALADACDAVVTTSNALSLYAASKGLRTIVCCNTSHRRPEQFFTRFARGPRSRIVEQCEGMEEFKAAWAEVMKL